MVTATFKELKIWQKCNGKKSILAIQYSAAGSSGWDNDCVLLRLPNGKVKRIEVYNMTKSTESICEKWKMVEVIKVPIKKITYTEEKLEL